MQTNGIPPVIGAPLTAFAGLAMLALAVVVFVLPCVRAIQLKSRAVQTQGTVLHHSPAPSEKYRGVTEYEITYEYVIGTRKYSGSQIKPMWGGMTSTEKAQLAGRFPVGSSVTVYYDPADPYLAFIDPDIPAGYYGATILAIFSCLALISVLIDSIRRLCKAKSDAQQVAGAERIEAG